MSYPVQSAVSREIAGRSPVLPRYRIDVAMGLHKGATVIMDSETMIVGSQIPSDIVLSDHGVETQHLRLSRRQDFLVAEAMEGGITINRRALTQRQGMILALPSRLSIGQACVTISRMDRTPPRTISQRLRWGFSVVTLSGLISISAVKVEKASGDMPIAPVLQEIGGEAATIRPTVQEVRNQLMERLRTDGLNHLDLAGTSNRIVVSGVLQPEGQKAWNDVLRWFDSRYGSFFSLSSDFKAPEKSTMPDLKLQAIWLGKDPYILLPEGRRAYVGANLGNGWTLQAIHEDKIVLGGEGSTFSLTY